MLTAEDEDQKNAYLEPFQRDEVPEHVRWKHAMNDMNEADTSDLDSDASESDGDVGSGASERSDWTE